MSRSRRQRVPLASLLRDSVPANWGSARESHLFDQVGVLSPIRTSAEIVYSPRNGLQVNWPKLGPDTRAGTCVLAGRC